MKKILFIISLLIFGITVNAQPTKPQVKGNEIKDLKDRATKYCLINLYSDFSDYPLQKDSIARYKIADISCENNSLYFVDKESGKQIRFYGITELFNFMYRAGWKYVDTLPPERKDQETPSFLFEKIENKN